MESKLLVGTSDGLRDVGSDVTQFAGREVRSLARNGREWWALIDRREVWRWGEDDDWKKITSNGGFDLVCLLPTSEGVLIGTSEPHLLWLRGSTLEHISGFDEVNGRDTWFNPAASTPAVRSMATDSSGTLYVNVHVGGIPRSRNGGITWEPTIDVDADVHQITYDADSKILLAASAVGLGGSEDQGDTWRVDTEGLHGTYLRAVAAAGGTVLVTASTGPYTDHAALYRKPIGSQQPFERCETGLPERFSDNIDSLNLAASGSRVAFATKDGAVYYSADEGKSWELVIEGFPAPLCVVFAD